MAHEGQVEKIEGKIKKLAQKIGRLELANENLHKENEALKGALGDQQLLSKALKHKVEKQEEIFERLRERRPEHSKKLREQIVQYIKEIDNCIDWLSKLE